MRIRRNFYLQANGSSIAAEPLGCRRQPGRIATVEGDLILRGGGDVDLNEDVLLHMLQALRNQGIKRIAGKLVIDRQLTPLYALKERMANGSTTDGTSASRLKGTIL